MKCLIAALVLSLTGAPARAEPCSIPVQLIAGQKVTCDGVGLSDETLLDLATKAKENESNKAKLLILEADLTKATKEAEAKMKAKDADIIAERKLRLDYQSKLVQLSEPPPFWGSLEFWIPVSLIGGLVLGVYLAK